MKLLAHIIFALALVTMCLGQKKPIEAGTYRFDEDGTIYAVILTPHKSGNFPVRGSVFLGLTNRRISGTLFAKTGRLKAIVERDDDNDVTVDGHWNFTEGVLVVANHSYRKNHVLEKAA